MKILFSIFIFITTQSFCQFSLNLHAINSNSPAQQGWIYVLIPLSTFTSPNNGFLPWDIPLNFIDSIDFLSHNSINGVTVITSPPVSKRSTKAVGGGIALTSFPDNFSSTSGICWSNSPNPNMGDKISIATFCENQYFGYEMCCLIPGKTYYVRAFYADLTDTIYGNEISFNTENCFDGVCSAVGPGVSDIDNNYYPSIILGNGQEWTTKNLFVDNFSNGDPINVLGSPTWDATNLPAYFNGSGLYSPNTYGRYYNWYVVNDLRNVCPNGWHIPTIGDWNLLISYLGGMNKAGGRIKITGDYTSICSYLQNGESNWTAPNTNGTNLSGFSAQAAGWINNNGVSSFFTMAYFWSSSLDAINTNLPLMIYVSNTSGNINQIGISQNKGLNIRCIKD